MQFAVDARWQNFVPREQRTLHCTEDTENSCTENCIGGLERTEVATDDGRVMTERILLC